MDTGKIYYDAAGNKRSIWQMIRHEPDWAANRLQEGEKAIERVKLLENSIACFCREEVLREFQNDEEAVNYVLSFMDT